MKPAVIVGFVAIAGALAFGAKAFVTNLTPYITFADARKVSADSGNVQVMGALDKTSVRYSKMQLGFTLVETKTGEKMPVRFTAARPANFDQAVQVTAIGHYNNGVFEASNLLVKCPSKYQGTETKSYGVGGSKI